jgi:hypothetical protein
MVLHLPQMLVKLAGAIQAWSYESDPLLQPHYFTRLFTSQKPTPAQVPFRHESESARRSVEQERLALLLL